MGFVAPGKVPVAEPTKYKRLIRREKRSNHAGVRQLPRGAHAPDAARRVLASLDARARARPRRPDLPGLRDRWQGPDPGRPVHAWGVALYTRQAHGSRRAMHEARRAGD